MLEIQPQGQTRFPYIELIIFFVLLMITLFRKRLSSNYSYRDKISSQSKRTLPLSSDELKQGFQNAKVYVLKHMKDSKNSLDDSIIRNSKLFFSLRRMMNKEEFTSTPERDCLHNIFMRTSNDIMFTIIGYLNKSEIMTFSRICRNLNLYMKSDAVWEYLWAQRFGSMWRSKEIRSIRLLRQIDWEPGVATSPPKQGWRRFYQEFESCWMDWLLAGFCSPNRCLLGLHGSVLDITHFLDMHPGSPETLTMHSGCDATLAFHEIGHSSFAHALVEQYVISKPSQASMFIDDNLVPIYKTRFYSIMTKKRNLIQRFEQLRIQSKKTEPPANFATSFDKAVSYLSDPSIQGITSARFRSIAAEFAQASSSSLRILGSHIDRFNYKRLAIDESNDNSSDANSQAVESQSVHMSNNSNGSMIRTLSTDSLKSQYMLSTNAASCPSPILRPLVIGLDGFLNCSKNGTRTTQGEESSHHLQHEGPRMGFLRSEINGEKGMVGEGSEFHSAIDTDEVQHSGEMRVMFDPVSRVWWCWWTCCGKGYPCQH